MIGDDRRSPPARQGRPIDVAVIGAGQAGMASSYWLSQHAIDHVVLDRGRVAESWRSRRWDSFTLVGPNWTFDLPGQPYDGGEPDGFMGRDEIVARFEAYAQKVSMPLERAEVLRLQRLRDGLYRLKTSNGDLVTRAVVVATGAYQRRHRPPSGLASNIAQMHTDEYRNPERLPPGGVLVVGSGQSGAQIAEDLCRAGRSVWLATGTCGWLPRHYRGRDNVRWRMEMGLLDQPISHLGQGLRLACPPIQTGVDGGRDINLYTLRDAGVNLVGRYSGADGTRVHLADDLAANATRSDEAAARFRAQVDEFVERNGLNAPAEARPDRAAGLAPAPTDIDLARLAITTVIWATGYRLDFSWIELDLGGVDGYPEQAWGVSGHPGLYFMGLHLMHTRKSGLIFGVGGDAQHVVTVLAGYLEGLTTGGSKGISACGR